ncbi:MAG: enoyl-CoA hydratase-related protein [bacterium]|nr:enoyl-CoA hydratase [Gammaproteobacteria bacterium]
MSDTCLYETRDQVALITLNRPEKFNAFNLESYQATTDALKRANADDDIRCIVLTGAGRGFCSGDDVQELMGGDGLTSLGDTKFEIPGPTMRRAKTPIIAAVNGAAVGYGFELALMADIRIASTTARFSQMFIRRGLIAGADSFRILTQLCGPAGAAELLLAGDMIDAARALQLGVVLKVVEADDLIAEALALAGRIAVNPPIAIQRTRAALQFARSGQNEQLETLAKDALAELIRTQDHKESVAAFLEKRAPTYKGH